MQSHIDMNEDLNVMLNAVIFVLKTVSLPNVTYNLPRRFIPLQGKKKCKICFDYIIIIYIIVVFEHDDGTVGVAILVKSLEMEFV